MEKGPETPDDPRGQGSLRPLGLRNGPVGEVRRQGLSSKLGDLNLGLSPDMLVTP